MRFAEKPPLGLAIIQNEQRYDLVGFEPYTRLDGTLSELAQWSTPCADCGVEYLAKCSVKAVPETRRCPDHRKPGVKVKRAENMGKAGPA